MADKQQGYLASIRAACPALAIETVTLNDQGQNNDVLVVNGAWIFRFPKYDQALARLETETAILAGAVPYLPLAVPAPVYLGLAGRGVGAAFVGYRRIPGEPLWRETFRALPDEATVDRVAAQLAGFLRALHRVPVAEAIGVDLPRGDTRAECADLYDRMRQRLFPHMRPDARRWAADHFEIFLGNPENFDHPPVLKHSDFGPSNILYDRAAGRVVGVLDFGSSGLGDPAYDFAGLLSGYGEGFVARCARTYPEVAGFLERVRFYQGTFALLEALFGAEQGDEAAYRAGMARYV